LPGCRPLSNSLGSKPSRPPNSHIKKFKTEAVPWDRFFMQLSGHFTVPQMNLVRLRDVVPLQALVRPNDKIHLLPSGFPASIAAQLRCREALTYDFILCSRLRSL